jgi:hypothetical protein
MTASEFDQSAAAKTTSNHHPPSRARPLLVQGDAPSWNRRQLNEERYVRRKLVPMVLGGILLIAGCGGGSNNGDLKALVAKLTPSQGECMLFDFLGDGYTLGEQQELKKANYKISASTRKKVLTTIDKCKSEHPTP